MLTKQVCKHTRFYLERRRCETIFRWFWFLKLQTYLDGWITTSVSQVSPPVLLSAAAVDSTVSEPEQQGEPTPTPAHTLRLLHLSGQGTLVQESLSQ